MDAKGDSRHDTVHGRDRTAGSVASKGVDLGAEPRLVRPARPTAHALTTPRGRIARETSNPTASNPAPKAKA